MKETLTTPRLPGKWSDLTRRIASTLVLLFIGAMLLVATGVWLHLFTAIIVAITFWELARMTGWRHPELHRTLFGSFRPVALAILAGVSLFLALAGMQTAFVWLAVFVPVLAGLPGALARDRAVYAVFALAIMLVGYQLVVIREATETLFLLWIVGIVILSDTLGYFAGRMLGGPKFWPKISPKKTWSGTVAGWVGAVLWGAFIGWVSENNMVYLALASFPICLAGQMGDIAESWLKRRAGVKDSSNLIPGHGGLMDRFDALCGAILAASVMMVIFGWTAQGAW